MSFQQGLSGLYATAKNLEVIGNNVANSNTFGAKASRAEFSDLYATALNGSGINNSGIGVILGAVAQQFTQGNTETTQNPLDLALNGGGFFQVATEGGAVNYTRNGQFKIDREGYIVNNKGEQLLGYVADSTGVIQPGRAVPLQVPTAGITPVSTSRIRMDLNLDSRAAVTAPDPSIVPQLDLLDATTYNNATSVAVYDLKGQDVSLVYYFQKAASETWNVYITANGLPVVDDGAGNPLPSTTLTFPADGTTPSLPVDGLITIDIPATTNAVGATTSPITGLVLNLSGASQYGSNFAVTDLSQNGYSAGELTGIQFEEGGIIAARYSNGQYKTAGQVELANFRNPQGLQAQGGNTWGRTFTSGDPIVGTPGVGNMGQLISGALEASNIDLTAELVNMIVAQRTYQANAQTIKTQDQVLQTLVNLR